MDEASGHPVLGIGRNGVVGSVFVPVTCFEGFSRGFCVRSVVIIPGKKIGVNSALGRCEQHFDRIFSVDYVCVTP